MQEDRFQANLLRINAAFVLERKKQESYVRADEWAMKAGQHLKIQFLKLNEEIKDVLIH